MPADFDATAPNEVTDDGSLITRAYALATLVVPDPDRAESVVKAAFETLNKNPAATAGQTTSEKARLFALILAAAGPRPQHESVVEFERTAATAVLERAFPIAFSTLSSDERLVLYLLEVERLDFNDAGLVLGCGAEQIAALCERAYGSLWDGLSAATSDIEQSTLAAGLPDSWIRDSLRRTVSARPPEAMVRAIRTAEPAPPVARAGESPRRARGRRPVSRIATAIPLILLVGIVGYGAALLLTPAEPGDLLSLTAAHVSDTLPQFDESSPDSAASFIRDRTGRSTSVPVIRGMQFEGAGIVRVADARLVPTLYYEDLASGDRVVVAVYSYDMLDALEETTETPGGLLAALEEEHAVFAMPSGRASVAAWRHRANVFVATSTGAALDGLQDRLLSYQDPAD